MLRVVPRLLWKRQVLPFLIGPEKSICRQLCRDLAFAAEEFPRAGCCAVCHAVFDGFFQPKVRALQRLCRYRVCDSCAQLPLYRLVTFREARREFALTVQQLNQVPAVLCTGETPSTPLFLRQTRRLWWALQVHHAAQQVHGGGEEQIRSAVRINAVTLARRGIRRKREEQATKEANKRRLVDCLFRRS